MLLLSLLLLGPAQAAWQHAGYRRLPFRWGNRGNRGIPWLDMALVPPRTGDDPGGPCCPHRGGRIGRGPRRVPHGEMAGKPFKHWHSPGYPGSPV